MDALLFSYGQRAKGQMGHLRAYTGLMCQEVMSDADVSTPG